MTANLTPAQKQRARYETRKADQECTDCGSTPEPGSAWCGPCAKMRRDARARYMASGGREVATHSQAEKRAERARDSKCVECPRPRREGRVRCQRHLDERRESNARWRAAQQASPRKPRPVVMQMTFIGMSRMDALYIEAKREALGRLSIEHEWERAKVSRVYHRKLAEAGIAVTAVNEPPPGWSIEEDIREEMISLSEHLAMRKVG